MPCTAEGSSGTLMRRVDPLRRARGLWITKTHMDDTKIASWTKETPADPSLPL